MIPPAHPGLAVVEQPPVQLPTKLLQAFGKVAAVKGPQATKSTSKLLGPPAVVDWLILNVIVPVVDALI